MKRVLVLFVIASLVGCTPWARVDPANARFESGKGDFSLTQPAGWVRRTADANTLFLTRDGPALNVIVVNRQPHDQKLPATKRETRADMLPIELAELAIAEWKNAGDTENLVVVSNTPAVVGGKPAVRLHIRWKNERGLPIDRLSYALADDKGRFSLQFQAPALVYYARGLADFEAMVASVRF